MAYTDVLQQQSTAQQSSPKLEKLQRVFTNFWGWSLATLSLYVLVGNSSLALLWPVSWYGFLGMLDIPAIGLSVVSGAAMASWLEAKHRKLENLEPYHYWMQAIVRYLLAYIFLVYGFAKIFGQQFYSTVSLLDTPVGDISGLQLTWRFFGYSYAYTVFIAASQLVGAILLMFRRTTTLGAAVLLPVISNIVFLNFTHSIPVKLYSIFYLIMVAFLLFLDYSRLKALFWDNRSFMWSPPRPVITSRRRRVVKGLVISVFFVCTIGENYYVSLLDHLEPSIKGVWEVKEYRLNDLPVAATEPAAWRKVYFNFESQVAIKTDQSKPTYYLSKFDTQNRTIRLEDNRSEELFVEGTYTMPATDQMILNLMQGTDVLCVTLYKIK